MTVRVGINGFGSIGRRFLRVALQRPDIEVVAINDLSSPEMAAHLLKYDSNYGELPATVRAEAGGIRIDQRLIPLTSIRNPGDVPWPEFGTDVVIEATGRFRSAAETRPHLREGGPGKVIISAPAKGEDLTVVMGVNHLKYDPSRHHIISNASCTTNCLAPVAKVLNDRFGIETGIMTTVHAYTNDQVPLDFPHEDPRRARAAALNVIPTTTGAARAIGKVLPDLEGRLDGMAVRVPVPVVSLVDLSVVLRRPATADAINAAYQEAAAGEMAGILAYTTAPLVSSDFRGSPYSAIVDGLATLVMKNQAKVLAWYDNEWGYSVRLADLVEYLAQRDKATDSR